MVRRYGKSVNVRFVPYLSAKRMRIFPPFSCIFCVRKSARSFFLFLLLCLIKRKEKVTNKIITKRKCSL
uniref:Uncharacterized protein n=1 Tax=Meloidogyne enterolobii TaxID=390850 RepID=A0A6V7ULU6_MELEN|nr:unnamed protein product [Meloidogyne enterolobii]